MIFTTPLCLATAQVANLAVIIIQDSKSENNNIIILLNYYHVQGNS